jgi:hypothetical protein
VYGFEVVPAPNISRISFVCKDGKMVVDKMNVYQSAEFAPDGTDRECVEAFKHMRVLYVSEECPAESKDIRFYGHDSIQTVIIERIRMGVHKPGFAYCDNLETVRIGKGLEYIREGIFGGKNPKLSTVIIGSTLTFGDNVIDLMTLSEKDLKDLQGVIIFGDEVKVIERGNDFGSPKSKNSLSVVVFNRDIGRCLLKFYPSVKSAIWLNASRPDECPVNSNCDLILVPRENLSDFQNRYPYNSKLFSPLEDKISGLGYVDFLSFLKMLSQETINVE